MENLLFELTNEQRKYLGLIPVGKSWDLVKLKDMFLYFDKDIIRKRIIVDENSYFEQELCEKTAENRTVLLPKTAKGKPKKLNFTATHSFSPFGIYFDFSDKDIRIANYTTQTTFYRESFDSKKNIDDLKLWLATWIENTSPEDLLEMEQFKAAKRQHCKYKEGDFFAYKIGRRNWGFGRILIDVPKLKKTKQFRKEKNYGLDSLMGKALIIKVYHKISDTFNIDLEELSNCMALPPQAIMDNHFYYGENKIIGNKELTASEYDEPLISYCRSTDKTVYLQYGLIYKETTVSKFNKYLAGEKGPYGLEEDPYRNEAIGFGLRVDNLQQCIDQNSNLPYWNGKYYALKTDLRNPANIEIKRDIFNFFGLDADKSYEENYKSMRKRRFLF